MCKSGRMSCSTHHAGCMQLPMVTSGVQLVPVLNVGDINFRCTRDFEPSLEISSFSELYYGEFDNFSGLASKKSTVFVYIFFGANATYRRHA